MNQTQKQPTRHTATDSLFGMILATSFLGAVYGDVVTDACRTGENVAAVCEDRRPSRNADLGANGKLTGKFTRFSQGFEEPAKVFGLFAAAPAPAPRAFSF